MAGQIATGAIHHLRLTVTDVARTLAAKDFERIGELFAPEINFRAMTPRKFWEAETPGGIVTEPVLAVSSSTATGSPSEKCSVTSGAKAPKSRGVAVLPHMEAAAGSPRRSQIASVRRLAGPKLSMASMAARIAARPSVAPDPSSESSNPQPPTDLAFPSTRASPCEPVPRIRIAPSSPP